LPTFIPSQKLLVAYSDQPSSFRILSLQKIFRPPFFWGSFFLAIVTKGIPPDFVTSRFLDNRCASTQRHL
jgi:hypothetical protein